MPNFCLLHQCGNIRVSVPHCLGLWAKKACGWGKGSICLGLLGVSLCKVFLFLSLVLVLGVFQPSLEETISLFSGIGFVTLICINIAKKRLQKFRHRFIFSVLFAWFLAIITHNHIHVCKLLSNLTWWSLANWKHRFSGTYKRQYTNVILTGGG